MKIKINYEILSTKLIQECTFKKFYSIIQFLVWNYNNSMIYMKKLNSDIQLSQMNKNINFY